MAAVDLNDLVPSLIAQVSSPASPASTSLNWLQYLLNGFLFLGKVYTRQNCCFCSHCQ